MRKQSKVKRFFKRVEGLFVKIKQCYIVNYLINKGGGKQVVGHYEQATNDLCEPIAADSPIWICWWQGEKAMPDIVKACFNSVKKHACSHPVILVTEENYQEYVVLPDFIMEKVKKREITLTHFSDILRMALLSQHGGIWMDSTVLIPFKDLDSFIDPARKFWSCHHLPIYHNISKGGWVGFFLACGKNNLLPVFIYDFFLEYWKRHNRLIEYLLIDYVFAIARARVPAVHKMVEEVPITVMGPLGKCLNDEYSEEEWSKFCTDYDFHKLTYKIDLRTKTPQGKKTYYGHIIENFLPENKKVCDT